MSTLLIVGYGALGRAMAEQRVAQDERILAVCRHEPPPRRDLHWVRTDVTLPCAFNDIREPVDEIVYAVGPEHRDPATYRACFLVGMRQLLKWIDQTQTVKPRLLFVSSTAVYAQNNGEWVDEDSPASATEGTAAVLLETEDVVLNEYPSGIVLRLAGIYGSREKSLLRRRLSGARRSSGSAGSTHYVNRIHLVDAARAIAHLLALPTKERLYLGADNEPASQQTVLEWLEEHFELPEVTHEWIPERASSGHKRVANARLRNSGFSLQFPSFREGYGKLAQEFGLTPRRQFGG